MRYVSKIKTIADDDPANALYVGTLMHEVIENGIELAASNYYSRYPIISDECINEVIKVEYMAPLVRQLLGVGTFEYRLSTSDFIGFVDYVEALPDGTFALYDFKYSNNVSNYETSAQIHLYKYFFEQTTGKKVSKLAYVMIPKVTLKRNYDESIDAYRRRIHKELRTKEPFIHNIRYNANKVIQWLLDTKSVLEAKEYDKAKNKWCYFCEYREYCEEGIEYMILPENKRRDISAINKKKIWIYGAPFSGKTYLANQFPDPLMLNTDGNVEFIDAPAVSIKNEVTVEGRITKTKLAWELFKETISELEKKQNTFKTIVVDLLEDLYQHCRVYVWEQMGIAHESDDNFRAWDRVTTEFLNTIKRLMSMDYENIILISHEDMSRDITKKSGDKVTAIRPNLREKVATKVAGMVDLVARVIADDEKGRIISMKASDTVFGGGRLQITKHEIPNSYEELMSIYDGAGYTTKAEAKVNKDLEEVPAIDLAPSGGLVDDSKPVDVTPAEETKPVEAVPIVVEEAGVVAEEPGVRRRRRRRVEEV